MNLKNKIILIFAVVFIIVAPFLFTRDFGWVSFVNTGQIGDTIGGITAPIIGILSIYLLYKTLLSQQEFNKKQTRLMRDEQFKSTFFNLLQVQRDILNSLKMNYHGINKDGTKTVNKKVEGQIFFNYAVYELSLLFNLMEMNEYKNKFDPSVSGDIWNSINEEYSSCFSCSPMPKDLIEEYDKLCHSIRKEIYLSFFMDKYKITENEFDDYKKKTTEEKIKFVYGRFFNEYENCGYYFRHLYRILKFVDEQEKEDIDSKKDNKYLEFVQFIQAQMSTKEMLIVFYNSFIFPKAKELIIKYKLLENLTEENLSRPEHKEFSLEFGMKSKDDIFN